ncbi:hypothetical protein MBM_08887 [Drepanopeziza brunnea f. sp. 'multigermtubi' MB_m1]|uniref:Acyltransferase 3 domain-containing protein n=1 Tax=Marssonina brunnea f. sp. multigermtubi (strain MB_m1) TaxID=1072389 RepID=K1WW61_MARBU|nr:uncharacterized protein MBM_08887 [Drepanopeziza brunnea f. sp. 'multigermtubi' MB_m1]EKD12933.1 hypothetical protein MBM_08887 [Drepanopeziza brunnea f. sp. 'multigermtubi' MB_m1]
MSGLTWQQSNWAEYISAGLLAGSHRDRRRHLTVQDSADEHPHVEQSIGTALQAGALLALGLALAMPTVARAAKKMMEICIFHLCGITSAAYGPTGGHPDGAGVDALRNFWTAIGAFLLLLSMGNCEILQRPFTTGLASYMGDISFGFYIIHWTVLFTLGSFLISFFRAWLPYGSPTYNAGYFVGGLVSTIFALWAGDVYWRAFDKTSVKFARRLNGLGVK